MRRSPRGVGTLTVAPARAPTRARAIGASKDSLPSEGFASVAGTSVKHVLAARGLVLHGHAGPERHHVRARLRLLHLGVEELVAQREDARLEQRLGVLGVVVLGVLLQVTPLARGLDALGDLLPAFGPRRSISSIRARRLSGVITTVSGIALLDSGRRAEASAALGTIGGVMSFLRGPSSTSCAAGTAPSTQAGPRTSSRDYAPIRLARAHATRAAASRSSSPWRSHSRTRAPPGARRPGSSGCREQPSRRCSRPPPDLRARPAPRRSPSSGAPAPADRRSQTRSR